MRRLDFTAAAAFAIDGMTVVAAAYNAAWLALLADGPRPRRVRCPTQTSMICWRFLATTTLRTIGSVERRRRVVADGGAAVVRCDDARNERAIERSRRRIGGGREAVLRAHRGEHSALA